jgi:hypothetical protein
MLYEPGQGACANQDALVPIPVIDILQPNIVRLHFTRKGCSGIKGILHAYTEADIIPFSQDISADAASPGSSLNNTNN